MTLFSSPFLAQLSAISTSWRLYTLSYRPYFIRGIRRTYNIYINPKCHKSLCGYIPGAGCGLYCTEICSPTDIIIISIFFARLVTRLSMENLFYEKKKEKKRWRGDGIYVQGRVWEWKEEQTWPIRMYNRESIEYIIFYICIGGMLL